MPDNTDVFVPGETVPDPDCLPQDKESLIAATRQSVQSPIGMKHPLVYGLREAPHNWGASRFVNLKS